jgi:nucleoside-diphosphate-sugar epimerase
VFNVGTDDTVTSLKVAHMVQSALGATAKVTVVGESWIGDHPILLDCAKLRATGWEPKYTIREGVEETVQWLTRT